MDKILSYPIRSVTHLIHEGRILATELTEKALNVARTIKHLNAFITITEATAVSQSVQSATRHKNNRPSSDFLDGIPISIKDNFCTAGMKTTCAAKMLESFVPSYSATVYRRLGDAGVVLIGKTNLDEFAMGSGTVDTVYGPTKNPWGYDPDYKDFHVCGGSSGGSAVSVATNACYGSIGSDTGGSIRIPAAFCGLVGLKPTYGLISRWGMIPLSESMDCVGIITRKVEDCVILLNAVAGYDKADSNSRPMTFTKIRLPRSKRLRIKNLRIGVPVQYHHELMSKEVLDTWNEVAHMLADGQAIIKHVSLPQTENAIPCYSVINTCEAASNLARYDGIRYGFRAPRGQTVDELFSNTRYLGFNEVVRNRILTGNFFLLAKNQKNYYQQAVKVRRLILNDFDNVWEDVHFLLTPCTLSTAPKYSEYIKESNRERCTVIDYCTTPANLAGVPAVTIPIKLGSDGMPIGVQIIGRALTEAVLLALAKYIEHKANFDQYRKTLTI